MTLSRKARRLLFAGLVATLGGGLGGCGNRSVVGPAGTPASPDGGSHPDADPTDGGGGDGADSQGRCPAPAPGALYVDPVAGRDEGATAPSGAREPSSCRFATLTRALANAVAGDRVIAIAELAEGEEAVFRHETFPLVVPAGVGLITADPEIDPLRYAIELGDTGGSVPRALLELGDGAALRGFTIRSAGTSAYQSAIWCGTGTVDLSSVRLLAHATPAYPTGSWGGTVGLHVLGTCAARATELYADDFSIAVYIDDTQADVATTLTGGEISHSQTAIELEGGVLRLSDVKLSQNQWGITVNRPSALVLTGGEVVDTVESPLMVDEGSVQVSGTWFHRSGVGLGIFGGEAALSAGVVIEDVAVGAAVDVERISREASLTLNDVEIRRAPIGIQVEEATLQATEARVDETTGPGVVIGRLGGASTVALTGGRVAFCQGPGIELNLTPDGAAASSIAVSGVSVTASGGPGIWIKPSDALSAFEPTEVNLTVTGATIQGAGDVGILVEEPEPVALTVSLRNNVVSENGAAPGRLAGGVLFATPTSLAAFSGNRLWGNSGAQLGFAARARVPFATDPLAGSVVDWSIASELCDQSYNVISCYAPGSVGLALGAADIIVDARRVSWQNASPVEGQDFAVVPPGAAPAQVAVAPGCAPVTTCP